MKLRKDHLNILYLTLKNNDICTQIHKRMKNKHWKVLLDIQNVCSSTHANRKIETSCKFAWTWLETSHLWNTWIWNKSESGRKQSCELLQRQPKQDWGKIGHSWCTIFTDDHMCSITVHDSSIYSVYVYSMLAEWEWGKEKEGKREPLVWVWVSEGTCVYDRGLLACSCLCFMTGEVIVGWESRLTSRASWELERPRERDFEKRWRAKSGEQVLSGGV